MTTDDELFSLMGNDKNTQYVDSGDETGSDERWRHDEVPG
jgi:hypothetical protein